ncbi:uncharacterized protein YbjQ (UPF0145 family) [Rhodothalassium salexigens DSM 2132]|uniref:Uncharacterized protein YbjQ (UPF0145 family) n=1 Tax=Rhodothalassium salexigens DSM 2132 TaxID=1188247 RepID=A0A4R2PPK8_RHOSA|nr:heavy metal-binding domain-containing protein [Rhodothalassium salexigens]MBB4210732.1 uncharacterized protein YbjQ (UPF0145 family) [Rhodothalassium salexigens DSM 2132]TCP37712.1 uncharacterized protein YbjQ (UPF0145 family) [Rhodothalassium salexigens DSM 2132]
MTEAASGSAVAWLDWVGFVLPDTGWQVAFAAVSVSAGLWLASVWLARRHDRALDRHDRSPGRPLLSTLPPPADTGSAQLIFASVVLSHSLSRMLLVVLRRLVGGEVAALGLTVRRARREARRRLERAARDAGCDAVYGLRFAGVSLGAGGLKTVEVVVYGTAVRGAGRIDARPGGGR